MSDNLGIAPPLPDGEVHAGQVLFGRYRLTAKRGEHDDISRWVGWDEDLGRQVVMYVLPINHPRADALLWAARQAGPATDTRFLRVWDVRPFDPLEGVSLIVCEDCVGASLQSLLRDGPLPGLDAAWVVCEVASALAPLHETGLGHGALDPTAVVITPAGDVRIGGVLLNAAFAGRVDEDPVAREQDDVAAIGRLLYASLTGAWPDVATAAPPRTFGLPPAQWLNDELLSPMQARPGVSPILDAICMQVLQPRSGAAPLRTAEAVSLALQRALGAVDPSSDLATRVATALAAASQPAPALPSPPELLPSTGAQPLLDQPIRIHEQTPAKPSALLGPPQFHRRVPRWSWLVLLVIVVVLVISLAKACSPAPAVSAKTAKTIVVSAVSELDAPADGGDGQEHHDQVGLAADGDPATCWTSEQYAAGYIPQVKPGVGLVLDLGAASHLATITATISVAPLGVSVMVPSDQSLKSPPLDTVRSWTSLVDVTLTGTTQTVVLPEGTNTRFVMFFFTDLAPVAGKSNRVQASLCEVTATG